VGIELGHRFPRVAGELRPLLEAHDLSLVSGWYGSQLLERGARAERERLEAHLTLLHAMECSTLIFADVGGSIHRDARPLSRRPVLDRAHWSRFVRELDILARRLADEGVRLAYHHHVGTIVQTPDEIARLMDDTSEAVGLLLDTGHLAWGAMSDDDDGGALTRLVDDYGARVAHVHLKDVRRSVLERACAGDGAFLDAVRAGVFTVPGDGDADLAPVLDALRGHDYDGWIVVEAEQDPAIAHPLTYAKLGFAGTTRLIGEHARSSRPRRPRAPMRAI
jgi:inosose dehydratase